MGWLDRRRINKLDRLRAEAEVLNRKLIYQEKTAAFLSGAWVPGGSLNAVITTGGKQPNGLENSGMSRIFDHRALRANTRDAMYDSIHGRAIITRFADTIADTGLRARFEPIASVLGRIDDELESWASDVSAKFDLFMKSKDFSTDGRLTGYQAQWQYALSQQRDNDFYARLHYERDPGRISPVSVQHLDADQLIGQGFTGTAGDLNLINAGIEYDGKGREVSFNFMVKKSDGNFVEARIPKFGPRSKKRIIIHAFRPEYAGQREGYSLYAHALQRLEELTTLGQTYLAKAIVESTIGGWTKPSKDAPASGFMEDVVTESVDVIDDMLAGTDTSPEVRQNLQQAFIRTFPEMAVRTPGAVWVGGAGPGESIEPFKASTPSEAFSIFIDNMVSYLSASTGMPHEVLLMKFGESYSASRATLVLMWRIVNMWRAEMAADYLNPIAEAWLGEEISAGRIQAPGWSDPRLRAAWLNVRWIGSAMPVIDPKKESESKKNYVMLGAETLDEVALMHNGSDGRKNRTKLKKEFTELPLPTWENGGAQGNRGDENANMDDGGDAAA